MTEGTVTSQDRTRQCLELRGHRHPCPASPASGHHTEQHLKKLWWETTWQRYRIYSVLQEAHFPAGPSTNLILGEISDLITLALQIRPAYKTDREVSNKAELEQLGKEERKGRMLTEIKGIILSQGSLQSFGDSSASKTGCSESKASSSEGENGELLLGGEHASLWGRWRKSLV